MKTLDYYLTVLSGLKPLPAFLSMLLGSLLAGMLVWSLNTNDPLIIAGFGALGASVALVLHAQNHTQKRNDDSAGVAPAALLLIALSGILLTSLINAEEYSQETFIPSIEAPNCDVYGTGIAEGIQKIACNIGAFLTIVINGLLMLVGIANFLGNAISYNVPGAPWYVRAIFAVIFGFGIAWPLANLFRGTKA